ncbi:MAG TPA: virulence RhuM family protein [Bacilli bacterium]
MESEGQIWFYTTTDGTLNLKVLFSDETVWLTQAQIVELFQSSKSNISEHINHVFVEGELIENAVVRKFRTTAADGKAYLTTHYNLDVIISVGYRVRSFQGTQFRIWATKTLRDFIIKGYVLDDERLKNGKHFGKDYFDELLERIREIRASERRFYQKITDIYAECSIDYDKHAEVTKTLYATIQNKLHWAITGHTAAEIILNRVNASKPNMGLSTWRNAPKGKIMKSDITIAKNYLNEKEISELNRVVSMYLDYAELQAIRQIPMKMKDWSEKLDAFLLFNEYEVLTNAGVVSSEVAKKLADGEYEKFRVEQDSTYESDFDQETKKYFGKRKEN